MMLDVASLLSSREMILEVSLIVGAIYGCVSFHLALGCVHSLKSDLVVNDWASVLSTFASVVTIVLKLAANVFTSLSSHCIMSKHTI